MIITHNMPSITANRTLTLNNINYRKDLEKLSSGSKIVRASDDPTNLAVSEKMRAQAAGMNRAALNTQDGQNFIQTLDGYLNQVSTVVQRLRVLGVQLANGIYSDSDRAKAQVEVRQLHQEINRIGSQAQFNGFNLLTGRFSEEGGNAMFFHVGANSDQNVSTFIPAVNTEVLGLGAEGDETTLSLSTAPQANTAIALADGALEMINTIRADVGSISNRLQYALEGQLMAHENLTATESQLRDLNMAQGMTDYTRDQILVNANISSLAQANQMTSGILRLLG